MNRSINLILMSVLVPLLIGCAGCLGERYESNVPAANLELWQEQGAGDDSSAGRPRYLGGVERGSLPRTRGSLPYRGSLPLRGTMPNRGSTLPWRGSLPARGSLPLQRGTLRR